MEVFDLIGLTTATCFELVFLHHNRLTQVNGILKNPHSFNVVESSMQVGCDIVSMVV